jgi:hypothetical protein
MGAAERPVLNSNNRIGKRKDFKAKLKSYLKTSTVRSGSCKFTEHGKIIIQFITI